MIAILTLLLHVLLVSQTTSAVVGVPKCDSVIVDRKRIQTVINAIPVTTEKQEIIRGKLVSILVPPPDRHYSTPSIFRAGNGSAQVYVTVLETKNIALNPVTMTKYVWPYARKMAQEIYDKCRTAKTGQGGHNEMNVFFPNDAEHGSAILSVRLQAKPSPKKALPRAATIYEVSDKTGNLRLVNTAAIMGGTTEERPPGMTRDPDQLPSISRWSRLTGSAKKSVTRLLPTRYEVANKAIHEKTRFQSHQIMEPEQPGISGRPPPTGVEGPRPVPRPKPAGGSGSLMTKFSGSAKGAWAKAVSWKTPKQYRPANAPVLSPVVVVRETPSVTTTILNPTRSPRSPALRPSQAYFVRTSNNEVPNLARPPISSDPNNALLGSAAQGRRGWSVAAAQAQEGVSQPIPPARDASGNLPSPGGTVRGPATLSLQNSYSLSGWAEGNLQGPGIRPARQPAGDTTTPLGALTFGGGSLPPFSSSLETHPADTASGFNAWHHALASVGGNVLPAPRTAAGADMPSGGLGGTSLSLAGPLVAQPVVGAESALGRPGGTLSGASSMPEMQSVAAPPSRYQGLSVKTRLKSAGNLPGIQEASGSTPPVPQDEVVPLHHGDSEIATGLDPGPPASPYRPRVMPSLP